MIIEYHRPETLQEALILLGRNDPVTVPMGGGSLLNRPSLEPVAVVDLQALGLDQIQRQGNRLAIGATATLRALEESILALEGDSLSPVLRRVILHEATPHIRNVATVAGVLVGADGRSPFATALLALDARLVVVPGFEKAAQVHGQENHPGLDAGPGKLSATEISLGNLLPLRAELLRGRLITQALLPLHVRLAYEFVARTPADRPIVSAAVARWPSGRTRVALGGYGRAPALALDGPEPGGAEIAAQTAYSQAGDSWASAEYRQAMAAILTRRCLETVAGAQLA